MFNFVGFFGQKASSMFSWKQNGSNLAVICPEGETKSNWRSQAKSLGLAMIDTPSTDLVDDSKTLLGWSLPDEPRTMRGDKIGTSVADYTALCKKLRAVSSTLRLWGTFAGSDITAAYPWYDGKTDKPYFQSDTDPNRVTDIALDWYPDNRGYPDSLVGLQCQLVKSWTNNTRKVWTVLECSDQGLTLGSDKIFKMPTTSSMLAQAKLADDQGCEGVVWFPQKLKNGSFSYDNRNPDQVAGCLAVSQRFLKQFVVVPSVVTSDQ